MACTNASGTPIISCERLSITFSLPYVCHQYGKGIWLPLIFSNLHYLRMEGDTTKEHQMDSMDICSICLLDWILFYRISSHYDQVREHMPGSHTFATDSSIISTLSFA